MAEQSAPIILVPGFWLGAWAWDEVADTLRADGHDVTALTLPGPGVEGRRPIRRSRSRTTSTRSSTRSSAADAPVVLAVHSATGFTATPRATASRSGSRRWSTSTPRPG